MPLDHFIDIEKLLAPISDDNPCGIDVRSDRSPNSSYYRIKDARNDGRSAERSAMMDESADVITPWQTVITEAKNILSTQSKDIEVTCWLIEGLIRLHGFTGLRDGMLLLERLIDQYWENLYPEPDEDGIESKVLPITGLNGESGEGTLLAPMRNTPLTSDNAALHFTFWEYQQARNADRIKDADEKSAREDTLGYSLKSIEQEIAVGDGEFFTLLVETLQETHNSFKNITATLRKYCGNDAPPSSNINGLLDEIIRTCQFIFAAKLIVAEEPAAEAAEEPSSATGDTPKTATVTTGTTMMVREGAIVDREDALKRLSDVAEYFRRYEPHTPIAPGIERMVKWRRMTVAELMMELLPDDNARGLYSQLTGVALDGSDTKVYKAPPSVAKPTPPAAAKAAEPVAAPAPKLGW